MALAAALAARGALRFDSLALFSVAIVPALFGMWTGQVIRKKAGPATLRRWFRLRLLGAEIALRPLVFH